MFTSFVIAAAITVGMLYGMNKVAQTLQARDPTRYFRINNVVVPKDEGPAKRPQQAELPPARPSVNYNEGRENPDETGVSPPSPHVAPHVDAPPVQARPRIAPVAPPQDANRDAAGTH